MLSIVFLILLASSWTIHGDCDIDLLVVVDASSSISGTFERTKSLVLRIADLLRINGDDNSRPPASATIKKGHQVALIEYSGPTRRWVRIPFGDIQSETEFYQTVQNLRYLQGTTLTGRALEEAYALLLDGRRPNNPTLVIIVTDGYAQDRTAEIADKINDLSQLTTYVAYELGVIAGDPSRVFFGQTSEERLINQLAERLECDTFYYSDDEDVPSINRQETPVPQAEFLTLSIPNSFESSIIGQPARFRPLPRPSMTQSKTSSSSSAQTNKSVTDDPNKTTDDPQQIEVDEFPVRPVEQPVPDVRRSINELPPECTRQPYISTCSNGFKSQFTLRWYFDATDGHCCTYVWGYCRDDVRLSEHPAIRTKRQCQILCGDK